MKRRGVFCQSWNCALSLGYLLPAFMNTGWENIGFCSVLLALFCSWRITWIVFWWFSPPSFSVPLDPLLFPTHTTYVLFYSLLFFPQKLTQLHWCYSFIDSWRAGNVQIFRCPTGFFFLSSQGRHGLHNRGMFFSQSVHCKLSIKQVDTCSEWEFSVSELV